MIDATLSGVRVFGEVPQNGPLPASLESHPVPSVSQKRINLPLQGARGLFCIFVFVFHVYNSSLGTIPALSSGVSDFFLRPLQYGVELFFGLSGFFIVRTISRTPSVAHFAWDRATRIYPVLWLTIVCVIAVSFIFKTPSPSWSGVVFLLSDNAPILFVSSRQPDRLDL